MSGLELVTAPTDAGTGLRFDFDRAPVLEVDRPAWLETWQRRTSTHGSNAPEIEAHALAYDKVASEPGGLLGEARLTAERWSIQVIDRWTREEADSWRVERSLSVDGEEPPDGVRLRLEMLIALTGPTGYTDFRFFAPPAVYDRNDLDGDGVDDYLGTQVLSFREDRLNALSVLAHHAASGLAVALVRADPPAFDDLPDRPERERLFVQRTDIGSLGWSPDAGERPRLRLRAAYPFDEGERSHALLLSERPGWGAFWPAATEPTLRVAYLVRVEPGERFIDVAWGHFARRLRELRPTPVPLPAPADELLRLRAESLDRYYLEADPADDPLAPAGYVLNCHPQDGIQLADIIQYGFTGQNILNATLMLRYGEAIRDAELMLRARRVIDFFVAHAEVGGSGLFHDLYNVPKRRMDCWWTGLLLPLAYAEPGGSLEELMGPLHRRWEAEIGQLSRLRGSYLRCMSESVHALLVAYRWEADRDRPHPDWLAAARRFGDFLLGAQEPDGSWFRAYDHEGRPLTSPAVWFGTTRVEQRSSSATPIGALLALAHDTGESAYLEAAVRAGRFVRRELVEPVRFNGGIHDPIYAKGQLIDNEGILYPMLGLLGLYRATSADEFLTGCIDAARLFASWICLWDVPLPPGSTLARYGFRSTGMGACDTCGAGYVHPFELLALPELIEIAVLSRDAALFDVAELAYCGCNQTVATPDRDWGYAFPGLQEEGYLISWWLADDPMFDETGFGHRWKGEGNKTCFPWIPAVGMACHWKLLDRWGTTDFSAIREAAGL
jgi:hypothetical protein